MKTFVEGEEKYHFNEGLVYGLCVKSGNFRVEESWQLSLPLNFRFLKEYYKISKGFIGLNVYPSHDRSK